jgi:uncharacterized protein YggE
MRLLHFARHPIHHPSLPSADHITVQVRDVANLDPLLVDLLRENNLEVEDISYETANERQHSFAAVGKAVADAKEKARVLAEASGLKLGNVHHVNVSSTRMGRTGGMGGPGGTDEEQSEPFSGTASPSGGNFFLVAPVLYVAESPVPAKKNQADAKPGPKPFALRQVDVNASANVQFEMTE